MSERQRFRAMRRPSGAGAVLGLAVLLGDPSLARAEQDPWWGRDKALHLGASTAAAMVGYGGGALLFDERWPRAVSGAGFALTLGVGKELYDLGGGGNASWKDLTWDLIGAALGVGISIGVDALLAPDGVPPATTSGALRF
ncbi:MAG TPA: hypothetical protein VKZ49_15255 [Polyangiaceae bacterium]|nr:hypothetical protein [Polyangiaceae bacterium]